MKHRCFSYLSPTNFKDSKANLEQWQILKVVHIFRSRMDSNRHGDWPLECKVIVEHEDVIQLLPLFPGEYSRSWNWLTTRYTLGTWGRMLPGGSWRRPLTSLEGSGMSGLPRDLQANRQLGSEIWWPSWTGFAFVLMDDPRDAEDATRELDGSRMCGRRVKVSFCLFLSPFPLLD